MEKYMGISHEIMTDIYNMSTCKKDYNFGMFTHNRERLSEMLEFADHTKNSLFVYKSGGSINLVLIRGKSNYISEKNILFAIKYDQNMIKSKNSMDILNSMLAKLEYQIGNNDLLEIERQRGFVRNQKQDDEYEMDIDEEDDNHNLW